MAEPLSARSPSSGRAASTECQPSPAALQKGNSSSRCRCGVCSVNLGRRLDLLEARVLSHWHEFLVYKAELQRKFEEVFASSRGGGSRPRGAAAAHLSELEQRLEHCERRSLATEDELQHTGRQLDELRENSDELRQALERLRGRLGQDLAEAARSSSEAQRSMAALEQKTGELQCWLDAQAVEIRKEVLATIRTGQKEVSAAAEELRASVDRRIKRTQEEALQAADKCRAQATGQAAVAAEKALRATECQLEASIVAAEHDAERRIRRCEDEAQLAADRSRALATGQAEVAAEKTLQITEAHLVASIASAESTAERRMKRGLEEALQAADKCRAQSTCQAKATAEKALRAVESQLEASIVNAENGAERHLRQVQLDLNASLAAAQQRMARMKTEAEASELSIQEHIRKNSDELVRVHDASEKSLLQRVQQVQSEVTAELVSMGKSMERQFDKSETNIEQRMKLSKSEASEDIRNVELALELSFKRSRTEATGVAEELQRSIAQVRRELDDRLYSDLAAYRDEMQTSLTAVGSKHELLVKMQAETSDAATAAARGCERLRDELLEDISNARDRSVAVAITVESMRESFANLKKDVAGVFEAHQALRESFSSRSQAGEAELQAVAADARLATSRHAEELDRLQGQLRSLSHRLGSVEVTAIAADSGFNSAKTEAASLRLQLETALAGLQSLRDELGRQFDGTIAELASRASKDVAVSRDLQSEARQETHRLARAQEELQREQRSLKSELGEQLQRLAHVERSAKEVARGEEASGQRVAKIAEQLERMARTQQRSASEGFGAEQLLAESKLYGGRLDDLQAQVSRLQRESHKSNDRFDAALRRLQEEAERRVGQVLRGRSDCSAHTDLWRELRELRSQVGDLRFRASPRSPTRPSSALSRSGGWLGEI
eukprot:TRINITY_DN103960_c0_g1_i1.p1 TRINITY_DN103960_c0_g1~~TRINITY_DN103960_c0_g1_i1.p1  ORF type:complete len:906 (+),score=252.23 TRINITY_DN103960_c0_g1_i1:138-2855(+)